MKRQGGLVRECIHYAKPPILLYPIENDGVPLGSVPVPYSHLYIAQVGILSMKGRRSKYNLVPVRDLDFC